MDGIIASPRPSRVRGNTRDRRNHTNRSIATTLNLSIRGFAEDRELTINPIGMIAIDAPQPIQGSRNFLVIVENPCHVMFRFIQLQRNIQGSGHTAEHVNRTPASYPLDPICFFANVWHIPGNRHRVNVSGDNHSLRTPQVRPRHNRISITQDFQMRGAT
ncbi:Uncharacterised protein [Chlamydia trachomatis]|nr:Uncharacterised protein [Chlamydia trachomatis]